MNLIDLHFMAPNQIMKSIHSDQSMNLLRPRSSYACLNAYFSLQKCLVMMVFSLLGFKQMHAQLPENGQPEKQPTQMQGSNTKSGNQNQENVNEISNDAPVVPARQYTFEDFVSHFPVIEFPFRYKFSDNTVPPPLEMIPEEFTKAFICDVKGSHWVCVNETGDPENDYNTLNSYYYFGKLPSPTGNIDLWYGIYDEFFSILYFATYSSTGELLYRMEIAGNKSSQEAKDAYFVSANDFYILDFQFPWEKIGDFARLKRLRVTHYQRSSFGIWLTSKRVFIQDQARFESLKWR